jgi:hypothetical protein
MALRYSDAFWGYSPDALLWGVFWPYGEFAGGAYDAGYGGVYSGDIYRRYRTRRAAASPGLQNIAETCSGFAPGVTDLPIQSFEQIVDPSGDQGRALQDLKNAAAKASDILKQSCASNTPLTPVARLDAIERRLQAMGEATEVVREPLVRLYGLLNDEQKRRLAALAGSAPQRRQRTGRESDLNISELCSSQAEFTNVPAQEIANAVSPNDAQMQELEKLKAASAKASDVLRTSCPSTVPDTIDSRLDAAQKRIEALIHAVDTIRPAVRDFFASLTDEQKAALNAQTQSTRSAASSGD